MQNSISKSGRLFQISGLDCGDAAGYFFFRPVPPFEIQQSGDGSFRKSFPKGTGGNAAHNGIGRDILCHHRPGADDCAVSNGHTGQDKGFISDPYIVSDDDVPLVVPGGGDLLFIQPPFLKKDGEGIGGKGG